MTLLDNITHLLGDDLKRTLTPGAKPRVAASCFSIYAFEALKAELEQVESVEFIFTSPTFVPTEVSDWLRKEHREFHIPKLERERSHHTEPKRLLDLARAACKDKDAPIPETYQPFNKASKDGRNMEVWSALLNTGIRSMIELKEEKDLDSLFTGGRTSALTHTIQGIEDSTEMVVAESRIAVEAHVFTGITRGDRRPDRPRPDHPGERPARPDSSPPANRTTTDSISRNPRVAGIMELDCNS